MNNLTIHKDLLSPVFHARIYFFCIFALDFEQEVFKEDGKQSIIYHTRDYTLRR